MNKWINKQRPITLASLLGIFTFIIVWFLQCVTEENTLSLNSKLKLSGAISAISFFMSWGLFYHSERSSSIFYEIEELENRAKKAKTKTELIILESDYRILRKKADNQGHYAKLNIIKGILETKKDFI